MSWSAKIQSDPGGVPGYNEFELVYNPSTQTTFKLQYNFKVGGQEADVLYHTPDNGHPTPIRVTNRPVLIFLTQDVYGDDWDDIFTQIDNIKRLVHGEFSQAVRSLTGGAPSVRVAILPDGASLTTYYKVMVGYVDASESYYKPVAVINKIARGVVIALTCEPFGCGDPFTLANSLPSSPHFVEDTDGDGLADGWTETGTPTTSINTTQYLVGGKGQAISTSTQFHGIYSSSVSLTNGQSGAGYVWLTVGTGGWVIQIYNVTDASVTVTKTITTTDSNSVSDKSAINSLGGTAWRVPLTWTNSTGGTKSYRIYIIAAASVSSNCIAHAAYLSIAATVPPAFSGAKTLTNNGVNYLDFWGIPGDVPALVRYTLSNLTTVKMVIGKKSDGTQLATAVRYLIQDTYFAVALYWITSSNYTRASADGAVSNSYIAASASSDDGIATAKAIGETIWRVYAVARASSTDNGLYAQWEADAITYYDTNTVTATTANTWELWDLGVLNPIGIVVKSDPLDSASNSRFGIRVVSVIPSSGTVDIDYLLLVPISEEQIIISHSVETMIAGDLKSVFKRTAIVSPAYSTNWRGSLWTVQSGNTMTRIVYHDFDKTTTNGTAPGDTVAITATIIPRTSHLLGAS